MISSSGCANCCSQPQLADYGIISKKLQSDKNGERTARFDLVRREDSTRLGEFIHENITLTEVQKFIDRLD